MSRAETDVVGAVVGRGQGRRCQGGRRDHAYVDADPAPRSHATLGPIALDVRTTDLRT